MITNSEIKDIIKKCYIEYNLTIPVNLYTLCKQLNITVVNTNIKKDGYFFNDSGTLYIILNQKTKNTKRQRFTLAHEIGHALLHAESEIILADSNLTKHIFNYNNELNTIEKEANIFACELLCPNIELQKDIPKKSIDAAIIKYIAKKYEVSIQMAAIQCLDNSKAEDEIIILYKGNEYKWHYSKNKIHNDIKNDKKYLKSFMDNYYKNKQSMENINLGHHGELLILSGNIK